jgi:PLP dependent protein
MSTIAENLETVRERICAAAKRSGRDPAEVTLVAVSKVHPAAAIETAYAAGQRHFGENYAKELIEKRDALSHLPELSWHFIGHLQRNKAKPVVIAQAMVETVDSLRLMEALSREAEARDTRLSCLIQVNVGEEAQKSGISASDLSFLLEAAARQPHLEVVGLMTIPPWDLDPEETRPYFAALRELRDQNGGAATLPHLSMGMSHDFEVAVEEGATLVRVGTAIFGTRPARK